MFACKRRFHFEAKRKTPKERSCKKSSPQIFRKVTIEGIVYFNMVGATANQIKATPQSICTTSKQRSLIPSI
jgi:hypothetical protein